MKTIVFALALLAASPAAAQCVCGGTYSAGSMWGGEYAMPVLPDGPLVRPAPAPYYYSHDYGYRNDYGLSDDEIYGYRRPVVRRYVYRQRWRYGW